MTTAQAPARYRRDHTWGASTALSLLVVVTMLSAGCWVRSALAHDGLRASGTARPTTPLLSRSIHRVVDGRLKGARLKALLGEFGSASAAADRLSSIARTEGLPVQQPSSVDFVVDTIRDEASRLSARLVERLDRDELRAALPSLAAQAAKACAGERSRLADGLFEQVVDPDWADATDQWIQRVAADPTLSVAMRRLPAPQPDLSSILRSALDPPTLPAAISSQLFTDLTFRTMSPADLDVEGRELAARLTWGIAAILFVALSVATISIAVWQLWTLASHPTSIIIAGIVAAIGTAILVWRLDMLAPGNLELLGPLLTELEGRGGTRVMATARGLSGLAAAAVVLMMCAGSAITWRTDVDLLEPQSEGLRSIFNTGAAMLVAGVIEVAALYGCAASAFEAGDSGALSRAAIAAAGFTGALFSAALALVYLPAVSTLRQRAREHDQAGVVAKSFGESTLQQFGRLLQALAPLLAALPASGLFALLQ